MKQRNWKTAVTVELVETDDGVATYRSLVVMAPYSKEFLPKARELRGRWNPLHRSWWFGSNDRDQLMTALVACYGADNIVTR